VPRALTHIPVLTAQECSVIREVVYGLKSQWVRRAATPFFSLGTASYLDAQAGETLYYQMARCTNRVLQHHVGWLYDRVVEVLAKHLQAPVCYAPRFALPGFHIFQADPAFETSAASIHCDLQYEKLDWTGFENPDFATSLSFTLSIALPAGGGGLRVWNIERVEILDRPVNEIRQLFRVREPSYEPYRIGEMVVHSGLYVHQIAPMRDLHPDDERITLQGHGICAGDRWYLYW
jgi:hypothetical protein